MVLLAKTGVRWAFLGFTGFYLVFLAFNGFNCVKMSLPGLYSSFSVLTGFDLV